MKASLQRLFLLLGLLGLAAWASHFTGAANALAQDVPSIGLDADPAGNSATSLGSVDSCITVSKGDTFQVDIFVEDIVDLSAWEILFRYDPSVVKLADRDVQMFLAASPGSEVFDPSETLPDGGGLYRLAAVDLAIPHSPDSGSGVLARLTLEAAASGVSPAEIARIDRDGNGTIDAGPLLTDAKGNPIAPSDPSGTFFAGPIANAVIAVDIPCEAVTPVPSPTSVATSPTEGSPTAQASAEPPLTSSPTTTPRASPTTTPVVTRTTTPATSATSTATPAVDGGDDGASPWVIALAAAAVVGAVAVVAGAAFFVRARRGSAG